jgi:hypothetical protein
MVKGIYCDDIFKFYRLLFRRYLRVKYSRQLFNSSLELLRTILLIPITAPHLNKDGIIGKPAQECLHLLFKGVFRVLLIIPF